jgi:hypothetical protein
MLVEQWRLFGGILLVYVVLNLILVQGLSLLNSGVSLGTTKHLLSGITNATATAGSLFLLLVGNSTGNNSMGSTNAYQFVLLLFVSLALIWAIRQYYAGVTVRIRDGFYRGMAPLTQFVLVLLCIGLELAPAATGILLYSAVSSNGIAAGAAEKLLWSIMTAVLVLASCYMLAGSLFALYIITLPEMTPFRALTSANQLVKNRRWLIIRKIVFLPVAIFILMALLVAPFLLFAVKAAPAVFFVVSAMMVAVMHSYMYGLYRELLNE